MLMKAERLILTRQLPKTGQTHLYVAGDDGDYEAGWWKGKKVASNKTRFLSKTLSGDDVVIDRATGLTWPKSGNATINNNGNSLQWATALAWIVGKSFGGFTDWRIPNIHELNSILDYSLTGLSLDTTYFSDIPLGIVWSSTTYSIVTTAAYSVDFIAFNQSTPDKTTPHFLFAVRGGV